MKLNFYTVLFFFLPGLIFGNGDPVLNESLGCYPPFGMRSRVEQSKVWLDWNGVRSPYEMEIGVSPHVFTGTPGYTNIHHPILLKD